MDAVEITASIHEDEPEDEDDCVVFTGMSLMLAEFDSETKKIVQAHHKNYSQNLSFVKICFKQITENSHENGKIFDCPVYETINKLVMLILST